MYDNTGTSNMAIQYVHTFEKINKCKKSVVMHNVGYHRYAHAQLQKNQQSVF